MINFINKVRENTDFNVVQYGYRACRPNFAARYFIRETYLLHYAYKGRGYLEADGVRFEVSANQAFLIFPHQLTTYVADENDPFEYRWVEFYGNKAADFVKSANLSPKNPIFTDNCGKTGDALARLVDAGETDSYTLTGLFWQLAATMAGEEKTFDDAGEKYVEDAINYIHFYVFRKTSVEDVANHLSINRSYFSRIFKAKMGVSPKQYIFDYHIEVAKGLLQNGSLSVVEAGESVGYTTASEFSKAFSRAVGMSPSEYKKLHRAVREEKKTDKSYLFEKEI